MNILGHICSRGHQLDTPKSKLLYSRTKEVPYGSPKGVQKLFDLTRSQRDAAVLIAWSSSAVLQSEARLGRLLTSGLCRMQDEGAS